MDMDMDCHQHIFRTSDVITEGLMSSPGSTSISRLQHAGVAPVEGQMRSRHGVMMHRQKVCLPEEATQYTVIQIPSNI